MPDQIILYGRPGCFMVGSARRILKRAKADDEYIDIRRNRAGRIRVQQINDGFESVPTIEFPDGTTLSEPSMDVLREKLTELGYILTTT